MSTVRHGKMKYSLTGGNPNFAPIPVEKGDDAYECHKYTYGCISGQGIAVTRSPDGDYPFFEVPRGSVEWDPA